MRPLYKYVDAQSKNALVGGVGNCTLKYPWDWDKNEESSRLVRFHPLATEDEYISESQNAELNVSKPHS